MDTVDLLSLESRSARVAAMLDARPALSRLWRRCLCISEAATSLSIEDVAVREIAIAGVDFEIDLNLDDPQSVAVARSINRALNQPRDLFSDPAEALRTAIEAPRMSSLVDIEHGGKISWAGLETPELWEEAIEEFSRIAPQIIRHPGPVTTRCIAISHVLANLLPERLPIAERLMFVFAEYSIRNREYELDRIVRRRANNPSFVLTPSLALHRGGLRTWSPHLPEGRTHLVTRLNHALGIEVGRLAEIYSWEKKRLAFSDLWQSGTTAKMADLLSRSSLVTGDLVMRECGVTIRTAMNLISAAEDHGLLQVVVRRRAFRYWAVPALAGMIADRKKSQLDFAKNLKRKQHSYQDYDNRPSDNQADKPDFSEALKAMDQALADADRHLSRYYEKVAKREGRAKLLDEE